MEVRLATPWPNYETTIGVIRNLLRLQPEWEAVILDQKGIPKLYPDNRYRIQEGDIVQFVCNR